MTFLGIVKDGRMKVRGLTDYLKGFKEGDKISIEVTKWKNKRTLNQNSYYWGGVLTPIAVHTGHSPEELHEIFKRLFITPKFVLYRGREIKMPKSTTDLSTEEFREYIERVRAEAGQMGTIIQSPDEYYDSK